MSIRILGTGGFLPEKLMTNEDFETMIDTSDEWITTRTGIKRRHYVQDGMDNAEMCAIAGKLALAQAGIEASDLGGIIVATVTPEMSVPSTAAQVQRALGVEKCVAFDVAAACSGFLYALKVAEGLLKEGGKPFLVCGSETLSRFMNMEDRASCVLFGDGAGAVVIEYGGNMKYFEVNSYPDTGHTIEINGMNTYRDGKLVPSLVSIKGKEVYVYSTRESERVVKEALDALNMNTGDVDWFVFHQANARIIKTAAERMGVSLDRFYINIDDTGNTSAASVPLVLDQMNRKGLLKKGDVLTIAAFGGGLTSGCAIYEW